MKDFETSKHLGYLLKEVQHTVRTRMDAALRELELTTPQYSLLSQIDEFPGLTNADLARRSFVTPQTMNLIVRSLEERRLVARINNEFHGRKQDTSLTSTGQALLKRAHRIVSEIETKLFGCLTKEEDQRLNELLLKIVGTRK